METLYPALIIEVLNTNKFGNPLYAEENKKNKTPLDIIEEKVPEDERDRHEYKITSIVLRNFRTRKIIDVSERTYHYKDERLHRHGEEKTSHISLHKGIEDWIKCITS